MTEDYVSFEAAKLLKEKGFDELCYACYEYFRSNVTMYSGWPFVYKGEPVHNTNDRVKCPTHQMAMKWLREVHKINLHLVPFYGFNGEYTDDCKWMYGIDFENKGIPLNYPKFNSYEEAVEAALKYCLTNLIANG